MHSSSTKTPLHVTIVSTQEKWHGGEKQAALLAEGLRQRGHRCTILCRKESEFEQRMRDEKFEVETFARRGRSPKALYQIRRSLRRFKPDVLHANDAHSLTASGIAGLGLSIPIRVAARRVDFPLNSPTRYRVFSDGLICVSNAVAEICASSGLPKTFLHVVHDGVEPAFAESGSREAGRSSLQLSDDQDLLLTVAKLTDHKGHQYFLKAFAALFERHPQAVVAFAGDGELRDDLEALAASLGVHDRVRFLGYRNDVSDLLAAADVIVQPSHMEGLCSSLIDAMLAAKPIVASRAGGIPDLLDVELNKQQDEPEPVAWLVPTKSPQPLADAIQDALANRSLATHRGMLARKRAIDLFTAEKMVDATLAAYDRIAELAGSNLFQAARRSAA